MTPLKHRARFQNDIFIMDLIYSCDVLSYFPFMIKIYDLLAHENARRRDGARTIWRRNMKKETYSSLIWECMLWTLRNARHGMQNVQNFKILLRQIMIFNIISFVCFCSQTSTLAINIIIIKEQWLSPVLLCAVVKRRRSSSFNNW